MHWQGVACNVAWAPGVCDCVCVARTPTRDQFRSTAVGVEMLTIGLNPPNAIACHLRKFQTFIFLRGPQEAEIYSPEVTDGDERLAGALLKLLQEALTIGSLVGNGGMDYGDYFWRLYRDYYRDPFPHSLLSTRQTIGSLDVA